jgi:hypothetical protein
MLFRYPPKKTNMVVPIRQCRETCGRETDHTIAMYAWACEKHRKLEEMEPPGQET